jgi:hypothetical protein
MWPPTCYSCGLITTYTFTIRVNPRNEFVQPIQSRLTGSDVTASLPAGQRGQSNRHTDRSEIARLKHYFWLPRCDPGLLTQKLIKKITFLACTTKAFEIFCATTAKK